MVVSESVALQVRIAEGLRDPHPSQSSWHTREPVRRMEFPGGLRIWAVVGYRETLALLRSGDFTRDWRSGPVPACGYGTRRYPEDYFASTPTNIFNADGVDHDRLFRLTTPYFSKPRMLGLRSLIAATADSCLDRFPGHGEVDLIESFAVPIPLAITGHVLGVPPDRLSDFAEHLHVVSGWLSPDTPQWRESSRMLHRLALRMMGEMWDSYADDVVGGLIRAHRHGAAVSRSEIAAMIVILMGAGYETTAGLLAGGTLAALADAGIRHRLADHRAEPDPIIEEVLRLSPPSPFGQLRVALRDTTLGGVTVKAGELVYPLLTAANRDPAVFADPLSLKPDRCQASHLSFGHGRRRCIGAEMARQTARTALPLLLRRFPQIRLATSAENLDWHGVLHVRIPLRLPVRL